ncbi:hypothetical protein VU09_15655 [Burkholderia pseudomallei]|nr:hypothetical protein VU09_15655 [Burkholderia pseudomallei]
MNAHRARIGQGRRVVGSRHRGGGRRERRAAHRVRRGRAHDRISDSRRAANRNRAAGAPVSAGSVRVVGQGDLPRAAGDALARRMSAPVALFVMRPCDGVRAYRRAGGTGLDARRRTSGLRGRGNGGRGGSSAAVRPSYRRRGAGSPPVGERRAMRRRGACRPIISRS